MTDTAIDDETPGLARRRRPIALIGALVVAALLALGLWLAYRPAPDQIQGMVDAREVRITSKVTGRIAAFHVEEGQAVKAGQLLYTLDSPEVVAKSEQAGGVLAAAQAVESKADEGARPEDIRAAEAQWRRAHSRRRSGAALHPRTHPAALPARGHRRAEGRRSPHQRCRFR
ncbi:MAG: biotin/lipoyl-binding protein [Candidatus Sphingomonas phytovorans]|nr:biotin/lipoyl-binding protein [Sphingomonas sp.]WEK00953.1 MAG: biotin/lipoyl-binding protein [Sphingomonas sp.]